jgi:hypothetical protein
MVTDVVRVKGDYNIQAKDGSITLTSPSTVVTGNLTVLGTQTSVDSVSVVVTGTMLVLNQGEPGPGITRTNPNFPSYTSGIMIARGNADATTSGAFLLYDDSVTLSDGTNSIEGMWRFDGNYYYPGNQFGGAIEVQAIRTSNGNTLNLLGADNPNAVVNVKGTTNYASNVVDPDDIPNKAYVDGAVGYGVTSTQKLQVGNSFLEILDNSISTNSQFYNVTNQIIATLGDPSNIVFALSDAAAQFQNLFIVNSSIGVYDEAVSNDIRLFPANGNVVLESGLQILQTSPVEANVNYTGIYTTSTIGGGGTGIHFVNTEKTDELVSRKKAIIYGIIF